MLYPHTALYVAPLYFNNIIHLQYTFYEKWKFKDDFPENCVKLRT